MKRNYWLVMAAVAIIAVVSGLQAQYAGQPTVTVAQPRPEPTGTQIDSLVTVLREANPWIKDPKRIPAGSIICIPVGGDTFREITVTAWMLGKRDTDCLWTLSSSYLRGNLDIWISPPVKQVPDTNKTPSIKDTSSIKVPAKKDFFDDNGVIFFLALCMIGLIVWITSYLMKKSERRAEAAVAHLPVNHPDRYPPVVVGGVGATDPNALQQIQANYPGLTPFGRLERGYVVYANGDPTVTQLTCNMGFGDGASREVTEPMAEIPGTNGRLGIRAVKAYRADGSYLIARSACLNGMAGDKFGSLPEGFVFMTDNELETVKAKVAVEDNPRAISVGAPLNPTPLALLTRTELTGPTIRIRRDSANVDGHSVDEWTVTAPENSPNPIDRVIVHDPVNTPHGDGTLVEVFFLRPTVTPASK